MIKFLYTISILCFLCSCGTLHKPYYNDTVKDWKNNNPLPQQEIIHSLYLIGDAGELDNNLQKTNAVTTALKKQIALEKSKTSLVFLGDNVYPHGLPKKDAHDRAYAEEILLEQISCAAAHQGKTYFIPGNHDWNKHYPGGRKAILRQEKFIEAYNTEANQISFLPDNACSDPEIIEINDNLVFVFLDTQWWLQRWQYEKDINQGCKIQTKQEFLDQMSSIFSTFQSKELVIMMHHPIHSDGVHGGHFGFKHHVFPLTEVYRHLWIPLPFIGSLYPAFRRIKGSRQDIPNNHNKTLMQELKRMAQNSGGQVIFASGHDHGLQYYDQDKIKYIISGAGGKIDFVKRNGNADYARGRRGFVKIDFYKNKESWAYYYVINPDKDETMLELRVNLRKPD